MNEPEKNSSVIPEWIKVSKAPEIFGVGKTWIYAHMDINNGPIKTSLLQKRGMRQGVRLISVSSLREFIESGVGKREEIEA